MREIHRYAFVFRFHNSDGLVSYDIRFLTVKEAREYYHSLCARYEYVLCSNSLNDMI